MPDDYTAYFDDDDLDNVLLSEFVGSDSAGKALERQLAKINPSFVEPDQEETEVRTLLTHSRRCKTFLASAKMIQSLTWPLPPLLRVSLTSTS